MRRALGVLLGLILLLPLSLRGQEEGPPPELRLLDRYVGEWTFQHSSGGSGTHVCKWIGDYFVSCEWRGTNAEGESITGLVEVLGYDAEAEAYTLNRLWGTGSSDSWRGWVDGDTWTFHNRDAPWGTFSLMVWTEEWPSDGSYTHSYLMKRSVKGGPWEATSEASATFTKVR